MSEHKCPYDGVIAAVTGTWMTECGKNGWLCDRCKEDRADYRASVIAHANVYEFLGSILNNPVEINDALIALRKPEAERG